MIHELRGKRINQKYAVKCKIFFVTLGAESRVVDDTNQLSKNEERRVDAGYHNKQFLNQYNQRHCILHPPILTFDPSIILGEVICVLFYLVVSTST
jgi:hypothetical protein